MADLFSTLGSNAQRAKHDKFNFGTPEVYPLVINRIDEGSWAGYADNGSDFYKVLNYLQGRGVEIYGVGEVDGNYFTVLTNWGKTPKDAGEEGPNNFDTDDLLASEINTLLNIGVTVWYGKIKGDDISYNC